MYLLISGLWSGTLYFGGFLGPTIAGQRSQMFQSTYNVVTLVTKNIHIKAGVIISSAVAGFMVDVYGFRTTTLLYWALYIVSMIVDMVELAYNVTMGHNAKSLDYTKF